jgi:serine O-acetyltransferase
MFNDKNPDQIRSRKEHISAEIKDGVIIGSNATIYPGIKIANKVRVGAGSVVTKSLDNENSTYVGVPAKMLNKNK